MKQLLLVLSFLLFFVYSSYTSVVFAKAVNDTDNIQHFDCSKSGECKAKKNQQNSLYADNLIPGYPVTQEWNISNKSNNSCRVYLFFKNFDLEMTLSDMISISAHQNFSTILDKMTFSDLLKKESIFLTQVPAKSSSVIEWQIRLNESVDNTFQGTQKQFKTILYSYCADNKKGEVAGVSTEQTLSTEQLTYIGLATVSSVSLLILK